MKVKISSLSKSVEFKSLINGKKINNKYLTIFFKKLSGKSNKFLNISFVAQKKIGNAVKRNRIKRKLKSTVQKLVKMNNLINLNYTYIIFGKEKVYVEYHDTLFEKMKKSFKRMEEIKL